MVTANEVESSVERTLADREKSSHRPTQSDSNAPTDSPDSRMADPEKARKCLEYLSPERCDRYGGGDGWVNVGMALRACGCVCQDWDHWSQGCPGKYQPGVCEKKWRTFGDKTNGLGVGSLIQWAADDSGLGKAGLLQRINPMEHGEPNRGRSPLPDKGIGRPETQPILIRMADVESREVQWLWQGRVALGRISLLVGPPGGGKSFLTTYAASRVSTGSPWADGSPCSLGSVLLISAEDDPSDTIRPRLDAQLADPNRVYLLSMVKKRQGDEEREVLFNLQDVDALEKALRTIPDIRLIVVDPIGSFLGGRVDSHRDSEVRSVLAPISKLAEKYGPAVLIVCHTRKSSAESADDMTLGSRGFVGLARSVWHVMRDRENKNVRLFLPGKNNLAAQSGGMSFSIGGDPPCVMWDKTPVTMTADECIAAQASKPGPDAGERKQAGEWLRNLLSDHGSMPVGDYKQPEEGTIVSESKGAGFTWATMRRAKTDLGIVPYRDQFAGHWRWRLPAEEGGQDDP